MDALVTDAHITSSVAGLRALGRVGLRSLAVAPGRLGAGLWSRCSAEGATAPDASADPPGFSRAIGRLAERHGPLVVYPGHEDAIEAIVGGAALLPEAAVVPFPLGEPLAVLRDKRHIEDLAGRAGLGAPRTLAVAPAGAIEASEIALPCVVKPARTRVGIRSALVAHSAGHLAWVLTRYPADEVMVVQELVVGSVTALALVLDREGRLVERFQQAGLETWPRAGGLISLGVSTVPDDELVRRLTRMLGELGYHGLVQLDLLETSRGHVLLDANPRFYASMPLALAAGVNLPAAWHAVATGGASPEPQPYRAGVHFRWLEGDLKDALRGRPRALLRRGLSPKVGAMWDRRDPVAGVLLAVNAAATVGGNQARAAIRRAAASR